MSRLINLNFERKRFSKSEKKKKMTNHDITHYFDSFSLNFFLILLKRWIMVKISYTLEMNEKHFTILMNAIRAR